MCVDAFDVGGFSKTKLKMYVLWKAMCFNGI